MEGVRLVEDVGFVERLQVWVCGGVGEVEGSRMRLRSVVVRKCVSRVPGWYSGFSGWCWCSAFLVGVVVDIDGVGVGVFEDPVGVWVGEVGVAASTVCWGRLGRVVGGCGRCQGV